MTRRTDEFKRLADRVVALRLEGLTHEEIAERTGARLGTVSGMLSRERACSEELNDQLMAAAQERLKAKRRFTDDPRAKRPDYGRAPMKPATETFKSTSSIET